MRHRRMCLAHGNKTLPRVGEVSDGATRRLFGVKDSTFSRALHHHLTATADAELASDQNRSAQLLREVKPTTARWKHLELGDRWSSTQLTRLRLGCSRLNADAHHRKLAPAAACPHCASGADETREHYLLDCPRWGHERAELWLEVAQLEIRGLQLPCSAAVLLGSTAATRNRSQLTGNHDLAHILLIRVINYFLYV